jgi:hypothetical protein
VRNLYFTVTQRDTDRTQAQCCLLQVARFDVYLPVNPSLLHRSDEVLVGDNKIPFNRCYLCKSLLSETLN